MNPILIFRALAEVEDIKDSGPSRRQEFSQPGEPRRPRSR